MLKTGAYLLFALAVGHLLCLCCLDDVFQVYHIETPMQMFANRWAPLPYLITIGIAIGLAGCGLYGLSAAGAICRLPLLKVGIYAIATVFLLRAAMGTTAMLVQGAVPFTELSAALISGLIGVLYGVGGYRRSRKVKKDR